MSRDIGVHAALLVSAGAMVGLGGASTSGFGARPWLDAILLILGGLVALNLAGRVAAAYPAGPPPARPRRTVRGYGRPERLAQLQRDVDFATQRAIDLHRLRPLVRAVAAHRLAIRHAVDLDTNPAAARALLGADLWELTRADYTLPADRLGPGIPLGRLAALVERLEAL